MRREFVERQSYLTDGSYKCQMHPVPLLYQNRRQIKRHLYFVHRADPDEELALHGFDSQIIEELSYECQGTSFEYEWSRSDFQRYCAAHENDETRFDRFLQLNDHYEKRWVHEQFILGLDLMRQYQRSLIPDIEADDDDYFTKISRPRDES